MMLVGLLFSVLIGSLIGTLVLRLTLWPAFSMAGAPKGKPGRLITGCFLMAFGWLLGTTAWQWSLIYAGGWLGGPRSTFQWAGIATAALSYLAAGAFCGVIAARTAPLPGVTVRALIAGGAVGVLHTLPAAYDASGRFAIPIVSLLIPLTWFIFPLWAVYHCALAQKRRVARYSKGSCVLCAYEKVGRQEHCTECGELTRHLCHHCRHVVDARPGERCPRCKKATIAASCWKCAYDWRGLDSPRCPECGVWKPVTAPANPA